MQGHKMVITELENPGKVLSKHLVFMLTGKI